MRKAFDFAPSPMLAAVLVCACGATAHASPHKPVLALHGREVHKEIESLEQEWRNAQLGADTKTMARLLDEDYVGISANGIISDKTQTLAARTAGTVHFNKLDFEDIKVRMHSSGTTAVVVSRADVEGTDGGQDISGRYRYMRVYVRKLGTWRIVSFEASRMK